MSSGSDAAHPRPWRLLAVALLLWGCDDDPTATEPICGEAPAVELGVPLQGRLSSGDAVFQGALIDYYSLRLPDSTAVELVLTSAEMDPFLYLFGSDGRVAAQAFDSLGAPAGEPESATLERRLPPGCHLIGASAWARGGRGVYTFRVDLLAPPPDDEAGFSLLTGSETGRSSARN